MGEGSGLRGGVHGRFVSPPAMPGVGWRCGALSQADITIRALRKCQNRLWSALPGYLLQKILASRRRARLRDSLRREKSDRFLAIASCKVMVVSFLPRVPPGVGGGFNSDQSESSQSVGYFFGHFLSVISLKVNSNDASIFPQGINVRFIFAFVCHRSKAKFAKVNRKHGGDL